ncbi:NUDIX hydrolase domain-like protein [Dichotomocladium elegans]|nr:NUDIX hydrolase domain-like protein [Dichotomocladium elegans]
MALHPFSASARVGREKQNYDENGVRQVAVAIPIDPHTRKVLLITSSKHPDVWVLPKGGWENDETQQEAAKREMYEESGVLGEVTRFISNDLDYGRNGKPKTHYWIYELEITKVLQTWPEQGIRERRWYTYHDAIDALRFKPFMQKALAKSSIGPPSN